MQKNNILSFNTIVQMKIIKSELEDHSEIFRLYRLATTFQKTKFTSHWPEFDPSMVSHEINEGKQWKLIDNATIACVWAIAYEDPLIWGEKDKEPSLYLHRIATNPIYRGQKLLQNVIHWSVAHAKKKNKKKVRLDTVGENKKLIAYYTQSGFEFLGLSKLEDTQGLPDHYHNATVSLFELAL